MKLRYEVTADFRPYQSWIIEAESESEARLELARLIGVPYEETAASIEREEVAR